MDKALTALAWVLYWLVAFALALSAGWLMLHATVMQLVAMFGANGSTGTLAGLLSPIIAGIPYGLVIYGAHRFAQVLKQEGRPRNP